MRLFHLADLHIGVERHGRTDSATGWHSRLLDFQKSWQYVVSAAIEERPDAVLIAGDCYHRPDPTQVHQHIFAEGIQRLSDAQIQTVVIPGNHDGVEAKGRLSAVNIFDTLCMPHVTVRQEPDVLFIPVKSETLALVTLPFQYPSWWLADNERGQDGAYELALNRVTRRIAELAQAAVAGQPYPCVLLVHGAVEGATYAGTERSVSLSKDFVYPMAALDLHPFNYVALGDIHRFQNLGPSDCPIIYPGSLDRVDFSEELEPKGFVEVTLAGGRAEYQFREVPVRRFVTVDVNLRDESDPTTALTNAIDAGAVADAVVRVRYQATDGQCDTLDWPRIHRALAPAWYRAGIERTGVELRQRSERVEVAVGGMTDAEALGVVLDRHPEWTDIRDDLRAEVAQRTTLSAEVSA